MRCSRSPFAEDLVRRRASLGLTGAMGQFDAAVLYALVTLTRPRVAVETGTHIGMSAAFVLQAMHDAGVADGRLLSIDTRRTETTAVLVPDALRDRLTLVTGDVAEVAESATPDTIDLFLHDSTHRYSHQLWEFDTFWPRLRSGGVLASHDVDLNASFVDFVSRTYRHDARGRADAPRRLHATWGRLGLIGFAIKS